MHTRLPEFHYVLFRIPEGSRKGVWCAYERVIEIPIDAIDVTIGDDTGLQKWYAEHVKTFEGGAEFVGTCREGDLESTARKYKDFRGVWS
ncbi:hypothetical protein CMO91_01565 [Candidatus Woesearchaeota archaeon]|nr:hypothetical protein [Candidatus Woesearchaeota archaeon]